jgi:Glycine-zipper domain
MIVKKRGSDSSRLHTADLHFSIYVGLLAVALSAGAVLAQSDDIYVYPARGQSHAQQDRDRYECHSWAVRQTGFDPSRATASAMPPPPVSTPYQPSRRHVLRGAGGGAALGAIGGAIAGDAGKGAAAGAAMGGVVGGVRRRRERIQHYEQQQYMQQEYAQQHAAHQSAVQGQRAAFNRALAACLTGRGYTVN